LFAHALHAESPRAEGPLVSINCAAIPKDLFESELFGYARGAFSGAHQDGKIGQIELADKGTLFLDEIGEMPPEIQAKLLRVLESRSVCPVGSVNARNVEFRLVAATNRNISAMLSAGSFREDLYYRINTFVLEIPPLCERADDILPIARYVLSRMGLEHLAFAPEAEAAMLAFSWPGNVRQLHNAVVHAATMRHGDVIQVDDFPPDTLPSADLPLRAVAAAGDLSDIMADTEAVVIRKVLAEQGGNVSRTARTLHIARATLYEKLRKYGISRRST
ncbi:MAG: sigma 54-interacting transcriptional regulator, partial [Ruthenibacterium sp.]|nr:sigma 54-interacting transcriptional regulator [Ruthenibacterium sp.]